MSKNAIKKANAKEALRSLINREDGIVIIIRSVAPSGLSRCMDIYTGDLKHMLTGYVADALELSYTQKGVRVYGCGMDMTFWLADALSYAIYAPAERETLKANGGGCMPWKCL